jgi:hypothetical protein
MTDCDRGTNVGELVDDVLFCLDLIADVPVPYYLRTYSFGSRHRLMHRVYVVQGIV